jgi:hypothetical protein
MELGCDDERVATQRSKISRAVVLRIGVEPATAAEHVGDTV